MSTRKCDNYKSVLCKKFAQRNCCPYGVRCHFAHGSSELRQIEHHRNHKTVACSQFSGGVCYYGTRCRFVHLTSARHAFEDLSCCPDSSASQRRLPIFSKITA